MTIIDPKVVIQLEDEPLIEVVEKDGAFRISVLNCGQPKLKERCFVPYSEVDEDKEMKLEPGNCLYFRRVSAQMIEIYKGRLRSSANDYICFSDGGGYLESAKWIDTSREKGGSYRDCSSRRFYTKEIKAEGPAIAVHVFKDREAVIAA